MSEGIYLPDVPAASDLAKLLGTDVDGNTRVITIDALRSALLGFTVDYVSAAAYETSSEAAEVAWLAKKPLWLTGPDNAVLSVNVQASGADGLERMAYMQSVYDWALSCSSRGAGRPEVRLTRGMHEVTGLAKFNGWSSFIYLTGETSFKTNVASVAFASTGTADVYECTMGVVDALPSSPDLVAGMGLIIQNPTGNNSMEAIGGGQEILEIVNSHTLKFRFWSKKGSLVDPTSITASITQSLVIIPYATLRVTPGGPDGAVWDGFANEGHLNYFNGAQIFLRDICIVYAGSAGTAHDTVFGHGQGSRLIMELYAAIIGGGDNVLRLAFGAAAQANLSGFGGAAKANDGIYLQDFCGFTGTRVWNGGYKGYGLFVGINANANFALGGIYSALIAVQTAQNSTAAIHGSVVAHCSTGLFSVFGNIYGDTATKLNYNVLAMTWSASGYLYGNFVLTGNTTDTVGSVGGNVLHNGGGWYKDTSAPLRILDPGIALSMANDAVRTAIITGTTGILTFVSSNTVTTSTFQIAVTIGQAGARAILYSDPANVVQSSGALTNPTSVGDIAFSLYLDGSNWKLCIDNDGGGTRAWRIFLAGNLQLGTFA